jgi:hypothetical protein
MTRHEREDYGEDAHDIIEGLRRLAHELETPPDLLPHILARGQQLLPQRGRFSRWWSLLASWRPQPLVWGPAIGVACFLAGIVVSPWHLNTSPSPTRSEQQEAKPDSRPECTLPTVVQDNAPEQPGLPSRQERSQPHADNKKVEMRHTAQRVLQEGQVVPGEQQTETHRESVAASPTASIRPPQPISPPPSVTVTTVLPTDLYAQLAQEAQRRHQDISVLVQEAVEAYMQKTRRPE